MIEESSRYGAGSSCRFPPFRGATGDIVRVPRFFNPRAGFKTFKSINMRKKTTNPLKEVFEQINNLPPQFRAALCEDCGWSMPTFYRKLRETKKITKAEFNASISLARNIGQTLISFADKLNKEITFK